MAKRLTAIDKAILQLEGEIVDWQRKIAERTEIIQTLKRQQVARKIAKPRVVSDSKAG
jgi:hypothetical protein